MLGKLLSIFKGDDHLKTFGKPRSWKWAAFEKELIAAHPYCSACGSVKNLVGHHIKPFWEFPELELDPDNICILCESRGGRLCHFLIGHGGRSWSESVPDVVQICEMLRKAWVPKNNA